MLLPYLVVVTLSTSYVIDQLSSPAATVSSFKTSLNWQKGRACTKNVASCSHHAFSAVEPCSAELFKVHMRWYQTAGSCFSQKQTGRTLYLRYLDTIGCAVQLSLDTCILLQLRESKCSGSHSNGKHVYKQSMCHHGKLWVQYVSAYCT